MARAPPLSDVSDAGIGSLEAQRRFLSRFPLSDGIPTRLSICFSVSGAEYLRKDEQTATILR
jgi:hypothetical protein